MGFRKGWGSDENRALGALLIGQTGKAEVLGHEKELPEGRPLQESLLLGQHCDFVCVCHTGTSAKCSIQMWVCC